MSDIRDKNYAAFLEKALRDLVTLPVKGICVVARLADGAVFTSYFNSGVMDKISYAGLIQQDAMIETMRNNKMINEKASADEDNS